MSCLGEDIPPTQMSRLSNELPLFFRPASIIGSGPNALRYQAPEPWPVHEIVPLPVALYEVYFKFRPGMYYLPPVPVSKLIPPGSSPVHDCDSSAHGRSPSRSL